MASFTNLTTRRVLFAQLGIIAAAVIITLVVLGVLAHPYLTRCVKKTSTTQQTYYCNSEEVVAWMMAIIAIILMFIGVISYLIYREVSKEKREIAAWKMTVKQRRFKVQRDKNFYIELMSRDSDTFKAVHDLVRTTWDAAVEDGESGNSRDGINLFHNQLRIKQIYEITNRALLKRYKACLQKDASAANVSMDETGENEAENSGETSSSSDVNTNVATDSTHSETGDCIENGPEDAVKEMTLATETGPDTSRDDKEKRCEPYMNSASYQFCCKNKSVLFLKSCHSSESYLFHGCLPDDVTNTVLRGFDPSRGEPGPYGRVVHLFESSEKADQLSDKKFSREDSDLLMILVRATLGRVYENNDSPRLQVPCEADDCEAINCDHALKYDSAITGHANSFRQILVYDPDRCYPHYVILYDRAYQRKTLSTVM